MTIFNSIKPFRNLLFLMLFFISGCAEKTINHLVINEVPPALEQMTASETDYPAVQPVEKLNTAVKTYTVEPLQQVKPDIIKPYTLWDRLFSLYALTDIDHQRVDIEVNKYLKDPDYLNIIQKRAEPYLYYIVEQIEQKQLPGEFALLPAIESAFRPNAISQSRASGLWQFMPATGRFFGLKQNWWYDGRNDISSSTQKATTYLKQLGALYNNDWLLALAAYNAGKGTIRKVMKKNIKANKATDYWSLPLRRETMNYVPKLLALAKIFANAKQYHISLLPIADRPHFDIVEVGSQVDLSVAAKIAQMSFEDFYSLNPGFKRWSTDPDGPYHLLIPAEISDVFKHKIANTKKRERVKWVRHKIETGESLGLIAQKYQTTVTAIRRANHLPNNKIRTGKFLLIPGRLRLYAGKLRTRKVNFPHKLYIVKKGDTFWDIARQFSVRSKDIANWNNISLRHILRPGQKLIIKDG